MHLRVWWLMSSKVAISTVPLLSRWVRNTSMWVGSTMSVELLELSLDRAPFPAATISGWVSIITQVICGGKKRNTDKQHCLHLIGISELSLLWWFFSHSHIWLHLSMFRQRNPKERSYFSNVDIIPRENFTATLKSNLNCWNGEKTPSRNFLRKWKEPSTSKPQSFNGEIYASTSRFRKKLVVSWIESMGG